MRIGERLRLLRESKGLTQEDVAKNTGSHRPYISRLENNSSEKISLSKLTEVVVEGCGSTLAEFFGNPTMRYPVAHQIYHELLEVALIRGGDAAELAMLCLRKIDRELASEKSNQ